MRDAELVSKSLGLASLSSFVVPYLVSDPVLCVLHVSPQRCMFEIVFFV